MHTSECNINKKIYTLILFMHAMQLHILQAVIELKPITVCMHTCIQFFEGVIFVDNWL